MKSIQMKQLIICVFALILTTNLLTAQTPIPCGETTISSLIGTTYTIQDELTSLIIYAEGGDGGGARRDVGLCNKRAEGGAGALIAAEFEIGTQADQLQAGGRLKTIVGRVGGEGSRVCSNPIEGPAGGGGGSTAVLYLPPGEDASGTNWRILMVASGGGGASRWADFTFYGGGGGKTSLDAPGNGDCGEYRDDNEDSCNYPGAGYSCLSSPPYTGGGCNSSGSGKTFVDNYLTNPLRIQLKADSEAANTGGADVENISGGDNGGGDGFTGGGGSVHEWGGGGGGFTGGNANVFGNPGNSGIGLGGTSYLTADYNNILISATPGSTGGGTNSNGYVRFETPNITALVCKPTYTVSLGSNGETLMVADDLDDGSTFSCGEKLAFFNGNTTFSGYLFICLDVGENFNIKVSMLDEDDNEVTNCYSAVSVVDDTPPNAKCRNRNVQLNDSGNGSITPGAINNGSTDNCGISSRVLDINNFTCNDIGDNTVTLTVTDNFGNINTCTATVTVQDNNGPIANCMDATIQLDANNNATLTAAQIDDGSSDVCGIQSFDLSKTNFDCSNIGANTVTLTVTDAGGTAGSCSSTVTVEDNSAPEPTCQDVTITLDPDGNYTLQGTDLLSSVADNCNDGVFQSANPATVSCADLGNAVAVTVTVTDGSGNTATCTSNVQAELTTTCSSIIKVWTGAIDSDWNNPCNWNPTCIPSVNDDVVIVDAPWAPVISNGTNVFVESVKVQVGGTLTIAYGGNLTIDGAPLSGLEVQGTVQNNGTINIDNTGENGIQTVNGSFTNNATINIGQNAGNIGDKGLFLQGPFSNNSTGKLNIKNTNSHSIQHSAAFDNAGEIRMGNFDGLVGGSGIVMENTFTNAESGYIFIVYTTAQGIDVQSSTLQNEGEIYVGFAEDNNIGTEGMTVNGGLVENNGVLAINNSVNESLVNNGGTVNNNACSTLRLLQVFDNSNGIEIFNAGLFRFIADGQSFAGNFINDGVIADRRETFPTEDAGFVNNEIIVAPSIGDCNEISPAFELGDNIDFNFLDFSFGGSQPSAGTYDLNTNVFTHNKGFGEFGINIEMEDPANGCTFFVPWDFTIEDTAPPVPSCTTTAVQLDADGTYMLTEADLLDGSGSDNCGTVTFVSSSISSFDCASVGMTIPVTVSTNDGNGNSADCIANITVEDQTVPELTCQDVVIMLDLDGNYALQESDLITNMSDNCGNAIFTGAQPATVSCTDVGNTIGVTVTVADGNGNTATCVSNVKVEIAETCPTGTRTWVGTIDNDWSNPCNWNPTCVPTINDNVIIPSADEIPNINANVTAFAKSVEVQVEMALTINIGGTLIINGSTGDGLKIIGTVNSSGTINIDNTGSNGIKMLNGGTFFNFGTINIGQNGGNIVEDGMEFRAGAFYHNGGILNIDNVGGDGMESGLFFNYAAVNIGQNDGNIANRGLYTRDLFQNNLDGVINIGNVAQTAIFVRREAFNYGQINIGQGGKTVEDNGILLLATFNNFPEAMVVIDHVENNGITAEFGELNNEGGIFIGQNGDAGNIENWGMYSSGNSINNNGGGEIVIANTAEEALVNAFAFNNASCATTRLFGSINNSNGFLNDGLLIIDTAEPSDIDEGTFTNNGVIGDVQGSLPTNAASLINNELIIAPATGDCGMITDAFELGVTIDFNILGVFTDEEATNSVGTYDLSSNTFMTALGVSSTLYVQVEDVANACTRVVPWNADPSDMTAPIAVCFNPTVIFNGESMIDLTIDELLDEASSSDNCGSFIAIAPLSVPIDCANIGSVVPITVTIEDEAGLQGTCTANVTVEGLACGWTDNGGIGCADDLNASSFDYASQSYTLTANNCAPEFPYVEDRMAFVYQELCGDGEIIARVTDVNGVGYAGVTIRNDLTSGSPMVSLGTNHVNLVRKQVRVLPSYPAYPQQVLSFNRFWVRIVRTGHLFQAYASTDGVQWIPYINQYVFMDNDCLKVGLYAYSEKSGDAVTATFDNVMISDQTGQGTLSGINTEFASSPSSVITSDLNVYPNPASDVLNIDLGEVNWDEQIDLILFNSVGQQVRQRFDVQDAIEQIEVMDLESGVYNLMVKIGDTTQTKRVVITRP